MALAILERTVLVDGMEDPAALTLRPGAAAAVRRLAQAEHRVGVGGDGVRDQDGRNDPQALSRIQRSLERELDAEGATVDAFFFCAHDAGMRCDCSAGGLIVEAADRFREAAEGGLLISDRTERLRAGTARGLRGLLLLTTTGLVSRAELADEVAGSGEDPDALVAEALSEGG